MNDLERQYLRAAYELAMKDPRRAFREDEIATHLDLDTSLTDSHFRIGTITGDLMGRGYIESDVEEGRLGVVALKLTRSGIDEVERLADPIEQRKELRRAFLRAVYERADGNPAEFVYWRDLAPGYGFASTETPPSAILGVAEQLAGSGFITI